MQMLWRKPIFTVGSLRRSLPKSRQTWMKLWRDRSKTSAMRRMSDRFRNEPCGLQGARGFLRAPTQNQRRLVEINKACPNAIACACETPHCFKRATASCLGGRTQKCAYIEPRWLHVHDDRPPLTATRRSWDEPCWLSRCLLRRLPLATWDEPSWCHLRRLPLAR